MLGHILLMLEQKHFGHEYRQKVELLKSQGVHCCMTIKNQMRKEITGEDLAVLANSVIITTAFWEVPQTSRMRLVRDPKLIFKLFNLTVSITNLLVKVP